MMTEETSNIIPAEARGEEYCHQGVYSYLLGMYNVMCICFVMVMTSSLTLSFTLHSIFSSLLQFTFHASFEVLRFRRSH